jgi:SAM-dependent methyltransferase
VLEERASELEWMDGPDFGPREVRDSFQFILPVNRWLGGVQPLLSFLRRESRTWEQGTVYRVLDAGCGVGDVPVAVVRWARRRGYRVQVDAVDRHPLTVDLARQRCRDYPEISVFCQDVLHLDGQKYDYVHAAQFLHHFPNQEVVSVLKHLSGMARRKLVINDLVRAPVNYLAAWVVTLFYSPVTRHDARLSVRRGFTFSELRGFIERGGFSDFYLRWHFFYRFLLIVNAENEEIR